MNKLVTEPGVIHVNIPYFSANGRIGKVTVSRTGSELTTEFVFEGEGYVVYWTDASVGAPYKRTLRDRIETQWLRVTWRLGGLRRTVGFWIAGEER